MMKIRKAKIAAIVILSLIAFGSCGKGDSDWTNYDTFEANQGGGGGGGDDNTAPVANAGSNRHVEPGLVKLDGIKSYDKEGKPLTYLWTIKSRPPKSAPVLSNATSVDPTFTADKNGEYVLGLTVSDGYLSGEAVVTLSAYPTLNYKVVDTAYNRITNKFIIISDNPTNSIITYDPASRKSEEIPLADVPLSISLGPDGTHVAISHAKSVSYIDLSLKKIEKTFAVDKNIKYLILSGNNYIYAYSTELHYIFSINIVDDSITQLYNSYISCKVPSLHPNGKYIYAGDNYISPTDIHKYDISTGPIQYLYDSKYHGSYEMGGKCWFSPDGKTIYASGYDIFTSSDGKVNDVNYIGSLQLPTELVYPWPLFVRYLDETSVKNRIAVLPSDYDYLCEPQESFKVYLNSSIDYQNLTSTTLPRFINSEGNLFNCRGKYVFFNSSGEKYYIICQADESAGIMNDFTIFEFETE